mgnify:CR=1 FL=1
MLVRLDGSVTPLVRELMMLEASETTEEIAPVAEAPTSLVRELTALVTPEMMGTEEKPGREGLNEVVPTLMIEDAPFVASLRMEEMALVGSTAVLIPLTSDASEEATPEGKTLVGRAVISLAIELSALEPRDVALVKPPRMEDTSEGTSEVAMGPTTEEIKPEGMEVAVGSSEISELKAPVLTALAVVSCETKEES